MFTMSLLLSVLAYLIASRVLAFSFKTAHHIVLPEPLLAVGAVSVIDNNLTIIQLTEYGTHYIPTVTYRYGLKKYSLDLVSSVSWNKHHYKSITVKGVELPLNPFLLDSVQIGDIMYIKHNMDSKHFVVYDTTQNTISISSNSIFMAEHACVAYNKAQNLIYVIGGYDINNSISLATTFSFGEHSHTQAYHVDNDSWSTLSETKVARKMAGCALNKGDEYIFLFGGSTMLGDVFHGNRNTIEKYSIKKNEWMLLSETLIKPMESLTCRLFPYDNKIYCLGGTNPYLLSSRNGSNIVQRFDPIVHTIEVLYMNQARYFANIALWNDNCMLIIGGISQDKFKYDPIEEHYQYSIAMYLTETEYYGVCNFSRVAKTNVTSYSSNAYYPYRSPLGLTNIDKYMYTYTNLYYHTNKDLTSKRSTLKWDDPMMDNTAINRDIIKNGSLWNTLFSNLTFYGNIEPRSMIPCKSQNDICYIECKQRASCAESIIMPTDKLMELIVVCDNFWACKAVRLQIVNVTIQNITVVCLFTESCVEMEIVIENAAIQLFTLYCTGIMSCDHNKLNAQIAFVGMSKIYCGDTLSCRYLNVSISSNKIEKYGYSIVLICADNNSCDYLWLTANDSIDVNIFIFHYSNEVNIKYHNRDYVRLDCGSGVQTKYSECHDVMYLQDKKEIVEWHRSNYQTNHLPCEGLHFYNHDHENGQIKTCQIHYVLDETKLTWMLCAFLRSTKSYVRKCPELQSSTNQSYFDGIMDIVWELNVSWSTVAYDKYFGDKNNFQITLIIMSSLFQNGISSCVTDVIFKMRPNTTSNIQYNGTSIVSISTHFILGYQTKNNSVNMTDIFKTNGLCYNISSGLINDYFGVSTIPVRGHIVNHIHHHYHKSLYSLCILVLVFCAIPVLVYYIYERWHTFVADRVLVLIIACDVFDQDTYNLPGVVACVNKLTHLWRKLYRYDVFICNEDKLLTTDQLYCSKMDVIEFVDKHVNTLHTGTYNGIILHVISHGSYNETHQTFNTSDMKHVELAFLKHEVNINNSFVKLIFHHACRTKNHINHSLSFNKGIEHSLQHSGNCNDSGRRHFFSNKHTNSKMSNSSSADTNCLTVFGTIQDHTLSDAGDFTDCICNSFGGNLHKCLFSRNLNSLVVEIGTSLENKTNGNEICDMHGTIRFKQIRFESCNKVRKSKKLS
eukprot:39745_1